MKTILTTAMILAIGTAPALAQSSATANPGIAPGVNGGVAGVGSLPAAMSRKTVSQTGTADTAQKDEKSKTAPSTSESPGVDHNEPKGAPSTASHTSPE
jgi:hypothetical protein